MSFSVTVPRFRITGDVLGRSAPKNRDGRALNITIFKKWQSRLVGGPNCGLEEEKGRHNSWASGRWTQLTHHLHASVDRTDGGTYISMSQTQACTCIEEGNRPSCPKFTIVPLRPFTMKGPWSFVNDFFPLWTRLIHLIFRTHEQETAGLGYHIQLNSKEFVTYDFCSSSSIWLRGKTKKLKHEVWMDANFPPKHSTMQSCRKKILCIPNDFNTKNQTTHVGKNS
jgi:hypothetical protein